MDIQDAVPCNVSQDLLKSHKWSDLTLRPYQLEGVTWLLSCYDNGHGCILSDEMGLGKTCQVIAMLTIIKGRNVSKKPHLVVCPRSVLENWEKEIKRFSPSLNVLTLIGDKETRHSIAQKVKPARNAGLYNFDILLTTYEVCLKDHIFLQSISWNVLIVDEGHRLKNSESLLYKTLEDWDIDIHILLSGTPLQNNLHELYSLLSFVDSTVFKLSKIDKFVDTFSPENQDISGLHKILAPYLLRRTKANVLPDLPEKNDIVLYHGLSPIQKKLYKAILTKDLSVFDNNSRPNQTSLMNILMQLRKCVAHPYLFDGVEPEPFVLGEHLIEASYKLILIDHLLEFLKDSGHKVLLFSQMSRMLDILQDYLGYRGYTYERLDGSVRGEERFLAVEKFNSNEETFVFLLSTKAGGQGLNLTAADTVVFCDSDFNPQNDLQAAARAHRIGQERPVKVIRLVGRKTVEEIILQRAEAKLKLTEKVIESGEFATPFTKQNLIAQNPSQLQDILKFGIDELLTDTNLDEPVDFEIILGSSKNGHWVVAKSSLVESTEEKKEETDENTEPVSMYVFEGKDYSKEPSAADIDAFEKLILAEKELQANNEDKDRSLRSTGLSSQLSFLPERKTRKKLSPEELEERNRKRKELAEKRAQQVAEQEALKAEARKKKREELWKANKYTSTNINLDGESDEESEQEVNIESDESEEENTSSEQRHHRKIAIKYVSGDVTHPVDAGTNDNIIVFCADDSGSWGKGGLFSALSALSAQPETEYELAGRMKDLSLGNCHLIPIDDIESREEGNNFLALIVAQHRDKRSNVLSGIKMSALETGLKKVYKVAKEKNASVHLPRIGHDTPGFNWYGTERLIQKHLSIKGIPTYIYYFPRKHGVKRKFRGTGNNPKNVYKGNQANLPSTSASIQSSSNTPDIPGKKAKTNTGSNLPSLFSGIAVYFHNIPEDIKKKLTRYILAYDGDLEKSMNISVTHLICSPDSNKLELNDVIKSFQCRVITPSWLEDCVTKGKLLPTEDYLISLV
ncbi:chromodomain-helicase-DNA-binding protein 1-like [Physella acuta]|uniref:chromodomain-helicase-DNA-binding protein 1-like n=1 Tax=Physella acuta TaxID=109671 RepID=UPI0027DC8EFA|nr:chromodomain-helicase-DNA-binding protein 1-like [Physella acuta]